MYTRDRASWLLPILLLLCVPAAAYAGRVSDDERRLERALTGARRCHALALAFGERHRCEVPEPTARYVELFDSLAALAFGGDAFEATAPLEFRLWRQFRCQLAIDAAVMGRLETARQSRSKRGGRARFGSNRRRHRRSLERLCDVEVARRSDGLLLPRVGEQCAAAVGDAGSRVDARALQRCLSTLVRVWVDRWVRGESAPRPNIVVILADDQRFDAVDATHSPDPTAGLAAMPAVMNRIADEGVLFTNSFVTTPVCGPARASFLTGQYVHRNGVFRNTGPFGGALFDDSSTLATWLQDAGYRTGFYGKYMNSYAARWRTAGGSRSIPPGWDDFRAFNAVVNVDQYAFSMLENGSIEPYGIIEPAYTTDVIAEQALDFIDDSAAREEPFLVYFSTSTPHFPWNPAPRHIGTFASALPWGPPSYFESDVSDKPAWVQRLRGISFLGHLGVQSLRQRQLEMQLSTDEFVDRLVDRLEELGISEETIIVYTSDNGQGWGEHRWNSKACPWDECLRVPLIVRYPALAPLPRTEGATALNIDLAATLAELAGAPMPDGRDGRSLVRVLDATSSVEREDFLVEIYSGPDLTYAGVREPDWSYMGYRGGDEELYDLANDPWQLENLADAAEHRERLDSMRARTLELWPGWGEIPF